MKSTGSAYPFEPNSFSAHPRSNVNYFYAFHGSKAKHTALLAPGVTETNLDSLHPTNEENREGEEAKEEKRIIGKPEIFYEGRWRSVCVKIDAESRFIYGAKDGVSVNDNVKYGAKNGAMGKDAIKSDPESLAIDNVYNPLIKSGAATTTRKNKSLATSVGNSPFDGFTTNGGSAEKDENGDRESTDEDFLIRKEGSFPTDRGKADRKAENHPSFPHQRSSTTQGPFLLRGTLPNKKINIRKTESFTDNFLSTFSSSPSFPKNLSLKLRTSRHINKITSVRIIRLQRTPNSSLMSDWRSQWKKKVYLYRHRQGLETTKRTTSLRAVKRLLWQRLRKK